MHDATAIGGTGVAVQFAAGEDLGVAAVQGRGLEIADRHLSHRRALGPRSPAESEGRLVEERYATVPGPQLGQCQTDRSLPGGGGERFVDPPLRRVNQCGGEKGRSGPANPRRAKSRQAAAYRLEAPEDQESGGERGEGQ